MRTIRIEGLMLGAAVLLAPMSIVAQIPNATGSAAQSQAAGQVAALNPADTSINSSAGVDTQLMKDRMFVRKATVGGYAEVQFGQLAAQKASSNDVKKLGQKLVDDRAVLDKEMSPAADELGVRAPEKMSKGDQEEFNKLSALTGAEFDKEYLTYSLMSHRKGLHEFHAEVAQTDDPVLKDALTNSTKVMAGHLYLVNKLALANGVPTAHKGPPMMAPPPQQ